MQTKSTKTHVEPVRLVFSEKDRAVVVETDSEDRFVTTVDSAIKACRMYDKKKEFESQFNLIRQHLGSWIVEHKDELSKAFITIRDTQLLFLPITKSQQFEPDFENDLTELDLSIAHSDLFPEIPLSVQSLPNCEEDTYEAFLAEPVVFEYEF